MERNEQREQNRLLFAAKLHPSTALHSCSCPVTHSTLRMVLSTSALFLQLLPPHHCSAPCRCLLQPRSEHDLEQRRPFVCPLPTRALRVVLVEKKKLPHSSPVQ
eukprot:TRINITY_DN25509_c0_g1_i1.p3 TRINITY_DN25509_c0_g1~~TRINITY_DN25509_c0_g1_i1.p3  ORF type:complete len:104 (+),score=8.16 TRINITY_DN25509_c0_g1_i1:501-812(+)